MELRVELHQRGLEHYLNDSPISAPYFGALSLAGQAAFLALVDDFARRGMALQMGKLFRHAVRYAADPANRASSNPNGTYTVRGDHGTYVVDLNTPSCTCRLFRGQHPYEGQAGVCSHIMMMQILTAA